jgi:hypothetical protein
MKQIKLITAATVATLLVGCATNGGSFLPNVTTANLSNDKLQVAVGTANVGFDETSGLNVVATLRQPGGLSAVLLDTPTITGPEGFTVPAAGGCSGIDVGTNHISASPQAPPGTVPEATTFGTSGGLFSYGVAPDNSVQGGGASFGLFLEPFYSPTTFFSNCGGVPFQGGPPAYKFFNDGSFPAGFSGYTQGFNAFEAGAPVAGQYSLAVNVPLANAPSVNFNANATLTNTTLLPLPAASLTEDGLGGGTANVNVGVDARVVETMIYIVDLDWNATNGKEVFYSVGPLAGTGALNGPLPDMLGPCLPVGCENTANATQTLVPGDDYLVYAVTYDYPAFEAGPPGNKSEAPAITGPNSGGQADIAISGVSEFAYAGGGAVIRHRFPHR